MRRRHFDHKPAILRAYHAADEDGTGFVERDEFTKLLQYIVFFNNLWCVPLFRVVLVSLQHTLRKSCRV